MFQTCLHIPKLCIFDLILYSAHLAYDRQLLLDKVVNWLRSNVLPSRSYDQILLSSHDSVEALVVN